MTPRLAATIALAALLTPSVAALPEAPAKASATIGFDEEKKSRGRSRGGRKDDSSLPSAGYAKKLRTNMVETVSVGDLEMRVAYLPDVYLYEMALGMDELRKRGVAGEKLVEKLRALHRKHKKDQRKTRFFVELVPKKGSFIFLSSKPKNQFLLREKRKRSFTMKLVKGKLQPTRWQIFEYPPNQPRKTYFKTLARVEKPISLTLVTNAIKRGGTDPIFVELASVVQQKASKDPADSINQSRRQLSCVEWGQVVSEPLGVVFYPKKWKRPKPPKGFRSLIEQLNQ